MKFIYFFWKNIFFNINLNFVLITWGSPLHVSARLFSDSSIVHEFVQPVYMLEIWFTLIENIIVSSVSQYNFFLISPKARMPIGLKADPRFWQSLKIEQL